MTTTEQAGRIQIGTAQYQTNPLLRLRPVSATLQGRQTQRCGGLDSEFEFVPEPQLRIAYHLVAEQQCILHIALCDIPCDLSDALGAQRVGRNAADRHIDRLPGLARLKQSRCQCRLQGHNASAVLKPGRHTADQATAAHAHQHTVGQPFGSFNFSGQRSGTRHHFKLVVGVQQQGTAGALAQQTGLQRLRIGSARDHHAGAELAQPVALGLTRQQRHEDFAGHSQRLRRSSRCNTGVATRCNDHTAGRYLVGKHATQHAARFETATKLQLFEFEPDFRAVQTELPAWQFHQRRAAQQLRLSGSQPAQGTLDVSARNVQAAHGWCSPSFKPLGSGNLTVSSMPFILRTDTAPSALTRSMTWLTRISGAEAPAVNPTRCRPANHCA